MRRDGGPEFVFACPRRGKSCLFARVGVVPFVGRDLSRGVRRVLEQIVFVDPVFRRRLLSFPRESKSSHRRNDQARVSVRSRSARSSSSRRPATKRSAHEIRNPSNVLPRLRLQCRRFSTGANRRCIRARPGRACPLKRTGKVRIEPFSDVICVENRHFARSFQARRRPSSGCTST